MEQPKTPEFNIEDLKQYSAPLLLVGVIIGILVVFGTVVYPNFVSIKKSWSETSKNNEQISLLESKLEILNSLSEGDLKDSIERSQVFLPVENEASELISYFDARTAKAEVVLGDFEISQSKLGDAGEIPLDIKITGIRDSIFKFNKALVDSGRLLVVNSLSLDLSGQESSGSSQLTEELTITSTAEPFPELIGSVESSLPQLTTQEQELLSEIQLLQPVIYTDIAPKFPARKNPFAP